MNRKYWTILVVVALVGAGAIFWRTQRPPSAALEPSSAETSGPVAQVKVVPLRYDKIEETLTVYGTVIAAPGEAQTFSAPFEGRVLKVFVTGGQVLEANAPLLEIAPSPDTQLQYDQARTERDSAVRQLALTDQRVGLRLATQQELLQAQQRARDAESRVQSMKKRGSDGPRVIRAEARGVVSQIAVQAGQIVMAGATLLETIGENQIVARLGIESEDVAHLKKGQAVRLLPVNAPDTRATDGHIRLVTQKVNPQTRLVDVFVAPATGGDLLLDEYVEGQIVIAEQQAFLVPRAAVLPEDGRFVLYMIEKGRAVKHVVSTGLENAKEIQVIGDKLQEGQPVVVVGNSELRDGMVVNTEPGS